MPEQLPNLRLAQDFHTRSHGIPAGHWISSQNNNTNVGPVLEVNILAVRDKAMRVHKRGLNGCNPIEVNFDHTSKDYQEIAAKAKLVDACCMAGPELLLYVHDYGLVTYFCANKTSRTALQKIENRGNRSKLFKLGSVNKKLFGDTWCFVPTWTETKFSWDAAAEFESQIVAFRNEKTKPKKAVVAAKINEMVLTAAENFSTAVERALADAFDGEHWID